MQPHLAQAGGPTGWRRDAAAPAQPQRPRRAGQAGHLQVRLSEPAVHSRTHLLVQLQQRTLRALPERLTGAQETSEAAYTASTSLKQVKTARKRTRGGVAACSGSPPRLGPEHAPWRRSSAELGLPGVQLARVPTQARRLCQAAQEVCISHPGSLCQEQTENPRYVTRPPAVEAPPLERFLGKQPGAHAVRLKQFLLGPSIALCLALYTAGYLRSAQALSACCGITVSTMGLPHSSSQVSPHRLHHDLRPPRAMHACTPLQPSQHATAPGQLCKHCATSASQALLCSRRRLTGLCSLVHGLQSGPHCPACAATQ